MACGVCGDPGHNRRTHSQHVPPQGEALIDQPGRCAHGFAEEQCTAPVECWAAAPPSGADRAREALRERRTADALDRWDTTDLPGGFVCSVCATPVESEPCREHQPVAWAKAQGPSGTRRGPNGLGVTHAELADYIRRNDADPDPAAGPPIELTGADPASGAPLTNVFDLDVVKTSDGTIETTSEFLARGGRLVGESGPEPITLEQARQMWPDRVVVEDDGSWSVEAITVQGMHGPGPSSQGGNQDTPIVTGDADAGQSPERCPACDVRLTDGESFLCSDCTEPASSVVPDEEDQADTTPLTAEEEIAVYEAESCICETDDSWTESYAVDCPEHGHYGIKAPWRTVLGPDEPIRITLPGVYDLTAEQYHDVRVTGDWLSNSDVKKILQTCPAQFQYDRWNGVRKISDAFDWGHVWHARVLGKGEAYRVFEPKKLDGRTKEGKAQRAEVDAARAAGITPIYGDQFALIEAMAQAIEADPVAIGLMSAPGRQEVCLFWTETIKVTNPQNSLYGQMVTVKRRAMIDHLPDMPDDPNTTVVLVDGKTADDVKPDDNMRKKIYDYGYHRQADTYAAGVGALFNRAAEVVFLFQSKKPPHLIVPVDLDTPAMLVAAAENRQVMEVWAECVETGVWPGYTKGIATSGVPAWIERQFEEELVIG